MRQADPHCAISPVWTSAVADGGTTPQMHTLAALVAPQLGAADAEIPSDENTELKGAPIKAWSQLPSMQCLLPGVSSLLISTPLVHGLAFSPKPAPSFSCVGCC